MDSQTAQTNSSSQNDKNQPVNISSNSGDPLTRTQPTQTLPASQNDQVAVSHGITPEHKDVGGSLLKESETQILEKQEFEPSTEVKEWVEKVESPEEVTLTEPVQDEYGQILMEAASPIKPKIVLPLSQPKTQQAVHAKIIESIRWLAEWCLRMLKMWPKRAEYGSTN